MFHDDNESYFARLHESLLKLYYIMTFIVFSTWAQKLFNYYISVKYYCYIAWIKI